jgi:hypothetical protein
MQILEVPILNDDGSVQYTAKLSAAETQTLLQFAINLSASVGLGAHKKYREELDADSFDEDDMNPGLND